MRLRRRREPDDQAPATPTLPPEIAERVRPKGDTVPVAEVRRRRERNRRARAARKRNRR